MRNSKIRILHIINSFEFGGAEAMLCNLVLRCDRSRFEPLVVSLIDDLTVAGPLLDAGIAIKVIGMKPGVPDPRSFIRLARHLWQIQPDLIQTWMDHSNLIGGVAARIASRAPVIWGIHHSDHVPGLTKRSTLLTVGACGRLSSCVPARIVFCADYSRQLYRDRHGFDTRQAATIPNGFDTSRFCPDAAARSDVRSELGVDAATPLIGLAARFDPLKDHATFLHAAAQLLKARSDVHFVLCGERVDGENASLNAIITQSGIASRCHLLGRRRDVHRLFTAMDIVTSSSISEAFPLVVGEAMACGVPCVVTDVGESSVMVGETGRVVPPKDPAALASAWSELLALSVEDRQRLGEAARRRVIENFDLSVVTRRYESLYAELAETRTRVAETALSL